MGVGRRVCSGLHHLCPWYSHLEVVGDPDGQWRWKPSIIGPIVVGAFPSGSIGFRTSFRVSCVWKRERRHRLLLTGYAGELSLLL